MLNVRFYLNSLKKPKNDLWKYILSVETNFKIILIIQLVALTYLIMY